MKMLKIILCVAMICRNSFADSSRLFDNDGGSETQWIAVGTFDLSGSALTLMSWIRMDSADIDACGSRFISKADGSAEADHWWMMNNCGVDASGGNLRMRLKTGGTTDTLEDGGETINADVWSHVAVVYDGTDMILYQDGVELDRTNKSSTIDTDGTIDVSVGRNGSDTGPFNSMDGEMADARIYDRALTLAEIVEASLCRNSNFNTLEAAYTLMGDDLNDYSGNGHNGTNNSTASSTESPGTSWCGGSS